MAVASQEKPFSGKQIAWDHVRLLNGFAKKYQDLCIDVTLPIELDQLERTGRLRSLDGTWKNGDPEKPHFFWDSDIAKWIEAVAYSFASKRDEALEARIDGIIEKIEAMQQSDGYFNIYYTLVEPGKRFTYVKRMHELYCLGHMIEAAVAYYLATGKDRLLNVVCRYVDLIAQVFGTQPGQIPGYDGHEEIELALFKLYMVKPEQKYLDLAMYFLNQRGTFPHFFEEECERRNEAIENRMYRNDLQGMYSYYQAHKPLREQRKAIGHAVRAMYIYCAMQDAVNMTGDVGLREACDSIWKNIFSKQLYITGGIGPRETGERFSYDYDLPNEMCYNETCSAIGLMMFTARKICGSKPSAAYGDVLERAFFNTVIGGVSLDGKLFYYSNPLAVIPSAYENMNNPRSQVTVLRQKWFDVACCPPNLARLLTSLGSYIYMVRKDTVFVNMYLASEAKLAIGQSAVIVRQETGYPYCGDIRISLQSEGNAPVKLALRIPSWSKNNYRLLVNGKETVAKPEEGIVYLEKTGDSPLDVLLKLDMRIRKTVASPAVRQDCGRIAIERGPLVYCFEECDNGKNLSDLKLDLSSLQEGKQIPSLPADVIPVTGRATRRHWDCEDLYQELEPAVEEVNVTAVPFYTRFNRGAGEMLTWMQY